MQCPAWHFPKHRVDIAKNMTGILRNLCAQELLSLERYVIIVISEVLHIFIVWHGRLEVNPGILIASFLVGVLPYRSNSGENVITCIF